MKKLLTSKIFIASAMICLCIGIIATCYFVTQDKDTDFTPLPLEEHSTSEWEETSVAKEDSTEPVSTTSKEEAPTKTIAQEEYPKTMVDEEESVITDFTEPQTSKPEPPAPPEIPKEQTAIDNESSTPPTYPDVEPSKPQEPVGPQPGDINEQGDCYMPGFGWIPDSGDNISTPAPNAGTGELIGDM